MKISKSLVSVSAVATSALGMAATLGAPQAFATDSKVYPGSMCVQWAGPLFASDGTTPAKGLDWSSVVNRSDSGPIYLDCPAIHDADSVANAWIRVTDRHPDVEVTCRFHDVYRLWNGHVREGGSGEIARTSGGGIDAGVQGLRFGHRGENGPSHRFFSCVIPPAYKDLAGNYHVSEIHTYYVGENN